MGWKHPSKTVKYKLYFPLLCTVAFFTYFVEEQGSYLYPASPVLSLSFTFPYTFHSSPLSIPSSISLFLLLPSLPSLPHLTYLSRDNLPVLCLFQPSQSDPVRGLMLWKMTVNWHFYWHHCRFGATCCWQPLLPGNSPDNFPPKGGGSCALCYDRDPSLISIISQFVLSFCC